MKRTMKLFLMTAVFSLLLAGLQATAFAAVEVTEGERSIAEPNSLITPINEAGVSGEASGDELLGDVANADVAETTTENPNPETGMESLVIPGAVALIAAATAAFTLTGKKN